MTQEGREEILDRAVDAIVVKSQHKGTSGLLPFFFFYFISFTFLQSLIKI